MLIRGLAAVLGIAVLAGAAHKNMSGDDPELKRIERITMLGGQPTKLLATREADQVCVSFATEDRSFNDVAARRFCQAVGLRSVSLNYWITCRDDGSAMSVYAGIVTDVAVSVGLTTRSGNHQEAERLADLNALGIDAWVFGVQFNSLETPGRLEIHDESGLLAAKRLPRIFPCDDGPGKSFGQLL